MTDRRGDWIQTYTGRVFWPMDPRPSEVNFWDIAYSLSKQCRYAGHCKKFYSVAQHSVLVSLHVAPEHALWGLLHDAAEAYLVDVPRPIKPYLAEYKQIEATVMLAIRERFGLKGTMPQEVEEIDQRILANEQAVLMPDPPRDWCLQAPVPDLRIEPITDPDVAAQLFIDRTIELLGGSRIGRYLLELVHGQQPKENQ